MEKKCDCAKVFCTNPRGQRKSQNSHYNKPAQPGAPSSAQLAARIKYNGYDTMRMMNATSERSSTTMRNKQGSFASVSKPHLGDQILIGNTSSGGAFPNVLTYMIEEATIC